MSLDKSMYEVALRICRRADELQHVISRNEVGEYYESSWARRGQCGTRLVVALLEYLAEQRRAAYHERGE